MRSLVSSCALCVLFVGSVAEAQDPDTVLRISSASSTVGARVSVSVTLDFAGDAIQAYEFEVCHDELVSIELADIQSGAATNPLSFAFHDVTLTDDGWSVDAALDVARNELEPGDDLEMYIARYLPLEEGTSTLSFCEGSVASVLSTAVEDLTPTTESGTIEIGPPVFLRGDIDGDGIVIPVADARRLLTWTFAGAAEPPCFEAADTNDNGIVSGLLDALGLLNWAFSSGDPPPDPGPEVCGSAPGACDTPPDPCGVEFALEPNADYALTIASATGVAGGVAPVTVSVLSLDEPIGGHQFSVCHDDMVGIVTGDVVLGEALSGTGVFTFNSIEVDDDSWTVGVLLKATPPLVLLETGIDHEIYVAYYTLGDVVGTSKLGLCEVGTPVIRTLLVSETNAAVVPEVEVGMIEILKTIPFRRGDADGDGGFSALLDALFLLGYGFLDGPAPPCLDAADGDDDGVVNGLLDAIRVLNYGFLDGPAPPDPGPDACGGDPSDDDLDCAKIAEECQ